MEELGRWTRDAPPTHFVFKIESFSTLSASSMERYESPVFEAVDAKWKLAIYPNGNKTRDGQDHISVYLVLADKSEKEIMVTCRLFVLDQIRDKYLTVEGAVTRFDAVKYESGFHKFLPLEVFNDAANGYLVKGTCLFGAEVFLIQHTNKFKCLSMAPVKSDSFRYVWKINKFSKLHKEEYFSEKFTVGGYDWKLQLYPKGTLTGKGNSLALYLCLVDDSKTGNLQQAEKQVIVEFKLRLVDQFKENHREVAGTVSFTSSSWGSDHLFSLTKLMKESNDYLVKDSLTLEADIIVLGSTTNWV